MYTGVNFMGEHYLKKELYQKIRSDNKIFDFLQEGALDGMWYWDLEYPEHEWLSDKFWVTFGYDPKTKKHLSSTWQSIIFEEDLKAVKENLKRHLKDRNYPFDQIVRYKHAKGHTIYIRCRGIAIDDEHGNPYRLLGAHIDVTKEKNIEMQLIQLKEEYETVFEGTQDSMFLIKVIDEERFEFIRNNKTHQEKTGVTLEMIQGKSPHDLLGKEAGQIVHERYMRCINARTTVRYEEELTLPSGDFFWQTTLTPIIKNNQIIEIVGSAIDITKFKALENELKEQANKDFLTGLNNRNAMYDYLNNLIESNISFWLYFIDLNDFKPINDNHGHEIGDLVLKEMALRLKKLSNQELFVARLGGDEFAVVCLCEETDYKSKETIIKSKLNKKLIIQDVEFKVHVAVGKAKFPEDGKTIKTLLAKADNHMYKNKKAMKSNKD